MGEENKEIARERMLTFFSAQEVCDALGITVEDLLDKVEDELLNYVGGVDD